MPLSPSARATKSRLIHKNGYTQTEAMTYLFENGFIEQKKTQESVSPPLNSISSKVNSPPVSDQFTGVTEELYESCLLELINQAHSRGEMTPQIIDKIRDYLDKKGKLTKDVPPEISPPRGDTADIAD